MLKAALYEALRPRDLTVADLSELLNVDWHQAARLIDPKRSSKLTSLATALDAVGCTLDILGLLRQRLEYPALKRAVRGQQNLYHATEILIEDKASGTQL